jgi:formylglycine-generating enzyme required for sulfatase activity
MKSIQYEWVDASGNHAYELVHVAGTHGRPFSFGEPPSSRRVDVGEFYIATVPVTQAIWTHLFGSDANPSCNRGPDLPLENVSWDDLTRPDGFLDRINRGAVAAMARERLGTSYSFRLPSETEWEYAARGGPHWSDGYRFSGSNDVDAVAWYDRRHGDHTQPVGLKAANQLGIYDMSGNVWEWCRDVFTRDVDAIPTDGTPYEGPADERVLRGGCFHNWAVHCTVSKRYEIVRDAHDGCIGFRLVLGACMPRMGRCGHNEN